MDRKFDNPKESPPANVLVLALGRLTLAEAGFTRKFSNLICDRVENELAPVARALNSMPASGERLAAKLNFSGILVAAAVMVENIRDATGNDIFVRLSDGFIPCGIAALNLWNALLTGACTKSS